MKTLKYLKIIFAMYSHIRASLVPQLVESARMQETQVRFLDREDLLEKEMATYSSILAWRIPWTEEPGRLQSMGSQESDPTEWLSTNTHTYIRRPDRTQETKNPGNRTMDESFTFYISIYVVTLFIGQIKTVLLMQVHLPYARWRQTKAKHWVWEQKEVHCRAMQGDWVAHAQKKPKLSDGLQQSIFKEKLRKYAWGTIIWILQRGAPAEEMKGESLPRRPY